MDIRNRRSTPGPERVFEQADDLAPLKRYVVLSSVLEATKRHLQSAGRARNEGALCWTGTPAGDAALITTAIVFDGSQNDGGVHVSPAQSGLLYAQCNARGLTLFAQVHSHPGAAFHSEPDGRLPHSPARGFLSVVIPSFGRRCLDRMHAWAIFEQVSFEQWREWSPKENQERLQILEAVVRIP